MDDEMLTRSRQLPLNLPSRARQAGVVLIIALIVLVAMMLAAVSLIRSVDTTTLVAGNLAFQQSATHSADAGVETALNWIQNTGTAALIHDDATNGYYSDGNNVHPDSATSETWDHYWVNTLSSRAVQVQLGGTDGEDVAGNKVYYVIDRMCDSKDKTSGGGGGCISSPVVQKSSGSEEEGGDKPWDASDTYYYRVTVRVVGPRNTVSYVQAVATL